MIELKPGDVLVQCGGQPWVAMSEIFCGKPFPHAIIVSQVHEDGIHFVENGKTMSWSAQIQESFMPMSMVLNGNLEVWRPNTTDKIKQSAISWMKARMGENYGFGRLIGIGLLYRLGISDFEGIDDEDVSKDDRRMVCSETIAMAFYRSGYDVAPTVSNRQTMPWDLRNPLASTRLF